MEDDMKISLFAWSFPELTLKECAGLARVLGIPAIDIGFFYRASLDRGSIRDDPEAALGLVTGLGVDLACMYHFFGATMIDRNLADPSARAINIDLHQTARFCSAAAIPTIFVLPGMVNPGQTRASAYDEAARTLAPMIEICAAEGVTLTIEPNVRSFLEAPDQTLRFLRSVPGLKLTIDYSHFVCLGYPNGAVDPLLPHAAHLHMRQTRAGRLQDKADFGTINCASIIGDLRAQGYAGYLACEHLHKDYINARGDDVLTEVVRMRDLIRRFL